MPMYADLPPSAKYNTQLDLRPPAIEQRLSQEEIQKLQNRKSLLEELVDAGIKLVTPSEAFAAEPAYAAGRAHAAVQPQNNLAEYGIPDIAGIKPYKTRWLDRTDKIAGKESRIDYYKADGALVVTYSCRGRVYSVAVDYDWKKPIDLGVIDKKGKGKFEKIAPSQRFDVPDWLI